MKIIMLGAGIVGLCAANLLAQDADLNIVLIDGKEPNLSWEESTYDLRCSAISRAAENLFINLGVWQDIIATRAGVYEQMIIWQNEIGSALSFKAQEIQEPNLGYIIENRVIQAALWQRLQKFNNVNTQFLNFDHLSLEALRLDADLIIGADGAASWLRTVSNIPTLRWSHNQSALTATIKSEYAHQNIARQKFGDHGPLAFLPLAETNLSSIVWTADPARISRLNKISSTEFCQELAASFDYALGDLELCGSRASFPLHMLHATRYIADKIALIGDAAHVVHPLAGQGMNLGIFDAATLAQVILAAKQSGRDISAQQVLRKYERERKGHNISMLAMVELFKRNIGTQAIFLRAANKLSPLKNLMARFAMGLNSDFPVSLRT